MGVNMTTFSQFSKDVTILQTDDGQRIRQKYINTFVNIDCSYYESRISTTRHFSDGDFYTGYLWDCIKHWEAIPKEQLIPLMKTINKSVFVFWDLHSSDLILITDYWKFPRNSVLLLNSEKLLEGIQYLPEDIYIFDESFSWSYINIHEEDCNGDEVILKATP
jgi:hypothetical protein